VAGYVGVPAFAIGSRRILVGVDSHQRRIIALVRRRRMDMQFAEPAAEGEMLRRRDVLIAKEDHEVFGERAMDFVHDAVGERAAEIDAGYLGANDRGELLHRDGLIGLGADGRVPVARPLLAGERTHGDPPTTCRFSQHGSPGRAKRNAPSRLCAGQHFWLFESSARRVPAALTFTHLCDTLCVRIQRKLPWESMSRWERSCGISTRWKWR